MNKVLALAAIAEAVTGVGLIIAPSLVARLLFGEEISGVSIALGRLTGMALLSLGLACWPESESLRAALRAMAAYNLLVTVFLTYLGIIGDFVGALLWPAVVLHAVLSLLLSRMWFSTYKVAAKRSSAGDSERQGTTR